MRWLTALHRWVGLALALVLLAVSVTGVLLLAKGPYYRWQHPSFARPIAAQDRADWPDVLEAITRRFGDEVRTIKVPQPGMHVFQVWLIDGSEAFVDARSGDVVDRWHPTDRFPALMFDLHAHLFAGHRGEVVNGVVALLATVFLVLGGALVWWPRRGSMPLRALWPKTWSPAHLLRSHAAVGVLTGVPVLVFVATGAGLALGESVMPALSRLLDATPPPQVRSRVPVTAAARANWQATLSGIELAVAQANDGEVGSARLVFLTPPQTRGATLVARVRMPGEWHPNGRSVVVVHPQTAEVLQMVDARVQGAGTRLGHALYPVHATRIGGATSWVLVAMALLAGLGLAALSVSGLVTWVQRRVRQSRGTPALVARVRFAAPPDGAPHNEPVE